MGGVLRPSPGSTRSEWLSRWIDANAPEGGAEPLPLPWVPGHSGPAAAQLWRAVSRARCGHPGSHDWGSASGLPGASWPHDRPLQAAQPLTVFQRTPRGGARLVGGARRPSPLAAGDVVSQHSLQLC